MQNIPKVYRRHGIEEFLTYLRDIKAHVYIFDNLRDDLTETMMRQAIQII